MTPPEQTPPHPAVSEVVRALDMAMLDWLPDGSFVPLTATPRWFTGAVPWSSLPFLEHFVGEARRFLHDHVGEVFASEPFTVDNHGQELLLRVRALKAAGRLVLAIERLEGAADMRPVLRRAREQSLEYEALVENVRGVHAPIDALQRALASLEASGLAEHQRPALDQARQALATLQQQSAALPQPRKRR